MDIHSSSAFASDTFTEKLNRPNKSQRLVARGVIVVHKSHDVIGLLAQLLTSAFIEQQTDTSFVIRSRAEHCSVKGQGIRYTANHYPAGGLVEAIIVNGQRQILSQIFNLSIPVKRLMTGSTDRRIASLDLKELDWIEL
jgi:hypothetical protein